MHVCTWFWMVHDWKLFCISLLKKQQQQKHCFLLTNATTAVAAAMLGICICNACSSDRKQLKRCLATVASLPAVFSDGGFWFALSSRVSFSWMSDTHPVELKGQQTLHSCSCSCSCLPQPFPSSPPPVFLLLSIATFPFTPRKRHHTTNFTFLSLDICPLHLPPPYFFFPSPTFISPVKHGLQFPCSCVFT